MKETPTEIKFNTLLKRTFENYVFYYTSSQLRQVDFTEDGFDILNQFSNKVYIFDRIKGPVLLDLNGPSKNRSIAYSLGKNKYDLIEHKINLEPIAFNFIFQDYYKVVFIFKFFSKLMLEALDNNLELPYSETYKPIFQRQCSTLEHHCDDLDIISTYIDLPEKNKASSQSHFETLATLFENRNFPSRESTNQLSNPYEKIKKLVDEKKSTKKKQRVAINSQEIEDFLLQSHFNVKLKN